MKRILIVVLVVSGCFVAWWVTAPPAQTPPTVYDLTGGDGGLVQP